MSVEGLKRTVPSLGMCEWGGRPRAPTEMGYTQDLGYNFSEKKSIQYM